MSLGPDDPRRVGGRYRDGYWQLAYEVLAFHDGDWGGRSITVRFDERCVWHNPPCRLRRTVTHGTAWDPERDRVLSQEMDNTEQSALPGPFTGRERGPRLQAEVAQQP